jgi:hypothetical protein
MGTAPRPDPAAPYWDVREVAAELGQGRLDPR